MLDVKMFKGFKRIFIHPNPSQNYAFNEKQTRKEDGAQKKKKYGRINYEKQAFQKQLTELSKLSQNNYFYITLDFESQVL